jgi:hypothetical protein
MGAWRVIRHSSLPSLPTHRTFTLITSGEVGFSTASQVRLSPGSKSAPNMPGLTAHRVWPPCTAISMDGAGRGWSPGFSHHL